MLDQLSLTKIEYAVSLVSPLAICLTRGKKVLHQPSVFILLGPSGRDISVFIGGCRTCKADYPAMVHGKDGACPGSDRKLDRSFEETVLDNDNENCSCFEYVRTKRKL
jgi:hypothetical protein